MLLCSWTRDAIAALLLQFSLSKFREFCGFHPVLSMICSFLKSSVFPARPEVTLKRYAGCLREIEVSRTPYNLLSSSDYTGITKGCNVEVRVGSEPLV